MSQSKINILIDAVDNASKKLAGVGKSVAGLAGKVTKLGDVAKIAAGVLIGTLARDALGALSTASGKASKDFMDYEATLTKIVSATDKTGEAAVNLEGELARLSGSQSDLGFSSGESAKALEALVKAGMSSSEAAEALRSSLSLARLENISTEQAAGLLVQTLTMFGLKASDSADALDKLSRAADAGIDTAEGYASGIANCGAAASNMGLTLNESLSALIQLDKTYGSATESGTYLNAMFKDLIKKSDDLEISLYNADGSMRSLDDIVGQIRGKVEGFGEDQKAANVYLSQFDVRAQRAVLGLINYDGSVKDTMKSMDSSRSVQEKMNKIMDTTSGKMAKVNAEMENASYSLGEMTSNMTLSWKQFALGLGPIGAVADAMGPSMLQGAMSGVMIMLPQLVTKQALATLSTKALTLASYASAVASKVLAAGQWLLNAAMSANPIMLVVLAIAALVAGFIIAYKKCKWFRDLIDGAAKVLKKVFGGALKKAGKILKWLGRILGDFLGWLGRAWEGTWKAAASFVTDPIGSIQNSVQGLVDGMASKFHEVHKETGNVWKATWESLKTIPVIGEVLGAVQGFADGILSIFGLSTDDIFNVWDDMWTGIQNFINDPIGTIVSGVQGLAESIGGTFQKNYEETGDVWLSTWEALKTIPFIGDILGAVQGIFDSIKGIVDGFVTAAFDWGKNLIQSFIDGITSMASGVTDAVSGIGGSIAGFLGIGSPAKKGPLRDLMKWGPNLTESFAEGILSGLPKVERAAEGVAASFEDVSFEGDIVGFADKIADSFKELSVSGVGQVAAPSAGFGGIVINVNVKGAVDRRTAEYAAGLMERRLRKVMVENTSPDAPTKMVRLRRARGVG